MAGDFNIHEESFLSDHAPHKPSRLLLLNKSQKWYRQQSSSNDDDRAGASVLILLGFRMKSRVPMNIYVSHLFFYIFKLCEYVSETIIEEALVGDV